MIVHSDINTYVFIIYDRSSAFKWIVTTAKGETLSALFFIRF